MASDRRFFVYFGAGVALVVAVVVLLLGLLGVFHKTSENVVAAAIGLLGVVITASISFLGQVLTRQAERRLRSDAAMRAGTLLNATDEQTPGNAAIASGLLALTGLDRADLAVALLVELWSEPSGLIEAEPIAIVSPDEADRLTHQPEGELPNEIAVQVIDAALKSSSENAQLVAAELLCRNSKRLDIRQSLHWPSAVDGRWNPRFNNKTKLLLVDALVRMALTSRSDMFALQSLAVRLYAISDGDPDRNVKGCVGMLLKAILPRLDPQSTLMQGPREVTFDQLQAAADHARPNPNRYMARVVTQRSEVLREWANRCEGIDFRPGALAAAGGR